MSKLNRMINSLGLTNFVQLRPYQQAREYVYGAIDIYLNSTPLETYSSPILEAMTARVPIIAINAGAMTEILENEETALLVPPNDPKAFYLAIERLLSNPELILRLTENAYQRALSHYSDEAECNRLEEIIQQIGG